jgi:hypothetical protein
VETARRAEALKNRVRWTEALQKALEELRETPSKRHPARSAEHPYAANTVVATASRMCTCQ